MSLEERRQAMKLTDKQTDGNKFCPIAIHLATTIRGGMMERLRRMIFAHVAV